MRIKSIGINGDNHHVDQVKDQSEEKDEYFDVKFNRIKRDIMSKRVKLRHIDGQRFGQANNKFQIQVTTNDKSNNSTVDGITYI